MFFSVNPANGSVSSSSDRQFSNILCPIDCIPLSRYADFRFTQPLNAELPIVCIFPEIFTDVSFKQFTNASVPIVSTVDGIVASPNAAALQFLNA